MASSDVEYESDSVEEQAKSLTICSICMDTFTNPKVLPCHHTFCFICLKNCYESINKTRLVAVTNFPCPTCRKVCYIPPQGLESLATDFRVGQILDLISAIENSRQSQQKNKHSPTGLNFGFCSICRFQCKETQSEGFCLQCEKAFCSQCLSHHAKTKIFQEHVVLSDKKSSVGPENENRDATMCKVHNADYKYFCEDCCILLCTVCCLFSEHNNHSIKEKSTAILIYETELAEIEKDLKNKLAKVLPVKESLDNMKKSKIKNYDECENEIKSAAKQAISDVEKVEKQLLLNLINNHSLSMQELNEASSCVDTDYEMCQKCINLVSEVKSKDLSKEYLDDLKQIKQSVLSIVPANNAKPVSQIDTFKFVCNLNVSIGTLVKNKKNSESTTLTTVSNHVGSNQNGKEFSSKDIIRKESINSKENKPEVSKYKKFDSVSKPMKISKLHLSVPNVNIEPTQTTQQQTAIQSSSNSATNLNSNDKKDSSGSSKPEAPDKIIKTLSRRLSGRLTKTALQASLATSPSRKKLHWVASGFVQCRGCCFLKIEEQWCIAACDYKATNAGDRIKLFDLKGKQHHVVHTRQIVEPWGLIHQSSSNSFVVTDHGSKAIKRIYLDEAGKCSRVITMSQSYLDRPTGISVTRSGDFVVTDTGGRPHRMALYSQTSNYVEKKFEFGTKGKGDGEIGLANYVVVDHRDRIIVSDVEEKIVKIFSAVDGSQILKFSCSCSFDGTKEMEPQGLAVDDSNNIFVADQAMKGVAMFSSEGQLINNVVSTSAQPWGIAYLDELSILAVATDKGLEVFEL